LSTTRRLAAGLLNLSALSLLLLGSCAGPAALYTQSPWWFLEKVDRAESRTFFVAFRSKATDGSTQIHVTRYGSGDEKKHADVQYHLPDGRLTYEWAGDGELNARIHVATEQPGRQLVRLFVAGDSPWTSVSEYRVADNKVYPLRHAQSVPWLLLSVFVCLFLTYLLMKSIRRHVNHLMRVEPAH
jgi:hypothetical protein